MAKDAQFYATLMNYASTSLGVASLDSTGNVPLGQLGNVVSSSGKASGDLVQMVYVEAKGFTTTNGFQNPAVVAPVNSTSGSGFGLTVNMKPTSAANAVYVRADCRGANSVTGRDWIALFLAGSTSAIMACEFDLAVNQPGYLGFQWKASTVSTATTSYAVRLGSSAASTFTLNGRTAAQIFDNADISSLTVWEVQN